MSGVLGHTLANTHTTTTPPLYYFICGVLYIYFDSPSTLCCSKIAQRLTVHVGVAQSAHPI